jgi:CheY-like chemotaxis protein
MAGYGSRLIRAAIERQLGGCASLDWSPTGLRCTLSIPRSETIENIGNRSPQSIEREQPVSSLEPISLAGNRILLVEDEGVTAMLMSDMLAEQGFSVIGPFAGTREAITAAGDKNLHGAVLDVNLRGELIYPVAEVLESRGVPFIFVTGYDPQSIERRFSRIPVLQKPFQRQALQNAFVVR